MFVDTDGKKRALPYFGIKRTLVAAVFCSAGAYGGYAHIDDTPAPPSPGDVVRAEVTQAYHNAKPSAVVTSSGAVGERDLAGEVREARADALHKWAGDEMGKIRRYPGHKVSIPLHLFEGVGGVGGIDSPNERREIVLAAWDHARNVGFSGAGLPKVRESREILDVGSYVTPKDYSGVGSKYQLGVAPPPPPVPEEQNKKGVTLVMSEALTSAPAGGALGAGLGLVTAFLLFAATDILKGKLGLERKANAAPPPAPGTPGSPFQKASAPGPSQGGTCPNVGRKPRNSGHGPRVS